MVFPQLFPGAGGEDPDAVSPHGQHPDEGQLDCQKHRKLRHLQANGMVSWFETWRERERERERERDVWCIGEYVYVCARARVCGA